MTRRSSPEPLTKVTLNLFERDYERMKSLYPKVGAGAAIRALLRTHIMKVEAKTAVLLDDTLVEELEVDIDV